MAGMAYMQTFIASVVRKGMFVFHHLERKADARGVKKLNPNRHI